MQRDFYKKDDNAPKEQQLLDNPLFIIGVVALSVFILLGGMQFASYSGSSKPQKVEDPPLEDSTQREEIVKIEEESIVPETPQSEPKAPEIVRIEQRIAEAEDEETLEKIKKDLETDRTKLVKNEKSKKVYSGLIRSIESKKVGLSPKETPAASTPDFSKTASIESRAKAFLGRTDFNLQTTTNFLKEYNGVNFNTLEALETYKSICEHKQDYLFLMSKLGQLGDDSYYEKGERLLKKKFKHISLDQFDEENYNWTTKNKPSWMSAAQAEEIKNWWNILDDEIERVDSDY
jgi:hypothetical protein